MYPMIDKQMTGKKLKYWMDICHLTVRDVQQYLYLGSPQSVYQWLSGRSLPTLDNLYALSELFQISLDDLICGNRQRKKMPMKSEREQNHRCRLYLKKMSDLLETKGTGTRNSIVKNVKI